MHESHAHKGLRWLSIGTYRAWTSRSLSWPCRAGWSLDGALLRSLSPIATWAASINVVNGGRSGEAVWGGTIRLQTEGYFRNLILCNTDDGLRSRFFRCHGLAVLQCIHRRRATPSTDACRCPCAAEQPFVASESYIHVVLAAPTVVLLEGLTIFPSPSPSTNTVQPTSCARSPGGRQAPCRARSSRAAPCTS